MINIHILYNNSAYLLRNWGNVEKQTIKSLNRRSQSYLQHATLMAQKTN